MLRPSAVQSKPPMQASSEVRRRASPLARPEVNLRILATIARLLRGSSGLAARLVAAPTPRDVLRVLREEEDGLVG